MVEFRFDISPLFTQPIVKVTSNLLPHTFRGDRRQCLDATSKMSEIIDRLGQLSANAQKLNTPVTTAQRLRSAENQTIYILADPNTGNHGAVIGLLKVGTKDLYLFDETSQTRKVDNAPCILDFYIHESRQRAGLGKDLFETMLGDEKWTPVKCSVDRPSEKLLGFLKKHYGLERSIPQANNFVLYEGFFDVDVGGNGLQQQGNHQTNGNGMYITNSPNTQLFGATYLGGENNKRRQQRQLDASNIPSQITQISPGGRYGARRPTCSMAEKNPSEVSMSPSQAEEQARLNARKNPLDALSKVNMRQMAVERRSGLQDVDEEYLKQNVVRTSKFQRNSGMSDGYAMQQQVPHHAAGQPSIPHSDKMQASMNPSQAQFQAQNQYHQSYQQLPPQVQMTHNQAAVPGGVPITQQQLKNPGTQIIHCGATPTKGAGSGSDHHQSNKVDSVTENFGDLQIQDSQPTNIAPEPESESNDIENDGQSLGDVEPESDFEITATTNAMGDEQEPSTQQHSFQNTPSQPSKTPSVSESDSHDLRKHPPTFHLSKQHTGMKNRSYGVGMAVTPTDKMEFDQESREDFGVVKINRPIGKAAGLSPTTTHPADDVMSTISSSGEGMTDQGYYDLKFYHNKLW